MPQSNIIRMLVLDDSSFDRARIRRISDHMDLPLELDEVGSIAEMDRAVSAESYDLILVDYRLPVGDGMLALDHIHHSPHNRNAGKIMITGNEALGTAVEAMRAGCHDFLAKDKIDVDTLKQSILSAIATANQRALAPLATEDHYRQIMRQGVLEALRDDEIRETVVQLFGQRPGFFRTDGQAGEAALDALFDGLGDPDDFIFH